MSDQKDKNSTASRVAFTLTEAMDNELERMLKVTDISSKPEVFRRAFTLLKIHVDAAQRGREIYMIDPDRPDERMILSLPFIVSPDEV